MTNVPMPRGTALEWMQASAGGYGDPLERDPEAVLRDVRDELVSVGQAFDDQLDYPASCAWTVRQRPTSAPGGKRREIPGLRDDRRGRPARRPAEPAEHLSDRRQGRDGRAARDDRPAQDRGDGHGAARRHPAACRCGGGPPARDPPTGVAYRALCPNRRGAERAVGAGADELLGLITASETYNRKNSNMSVDENLDQVAQMAEVARQAGVHMVMAIGVCMFCPYEGERCPRAASSSWRRAHAADGIGEFYLATSVG